MLQTAVLAWLLALHVTNVITGFLKGSGEACAKDCTLQLLSWPSLLYQQGMIGAIDVSPLVLCSIFLLTLQKCPCVDKTAKLAVCETFVPTTGGVPHPDVKGTPLQGTYIRQ